MLDDKLLCFRSYEHVLPIRTAKARTPTKLSKAAPRTLGQAGRVPGVTPAAMVALLRYVRRDSGEKKSQLKLA